MTSDNFGHFTEGPITDITIDRRIYCGFCKKEITSIKYIGFCGALFHTDCWDTVERKLAILLADYKHE